MDKDNLKLISLEELNQLKKENKEMKEQILLLHKKHTKADLIAEFSKEIITEIKNEYKKEKDLLNKNLEEIKQINKSTLDNLLNKTFILEESLVKLTDELNKSTKNIQKTMEEEIIKKVIDENQKNQEIIKTSISSIVEKQQEQNSEKFENSISSFLEEQKKDKKTITINYVEFNKRIEKIDLQIYNIAEFLDNLKTLLSYIKLDNLKK